MDEDEIDQYVDSLFRGAERASDQQAAKESQDRIDRIDEILTDQRDQLSAWVADRISEGTTDQDQLKSLPRMYMTPAEHALLAECAAGAQYGASSGQSGGSYERNGGTYSVAQNHTSSAIPGDHATSTSLWAVIVGVIITVIVCGLLTAIIDAAMNGKL
jgi:hypothetical protein